jgi:hypothetical protein
MNAILIGGLIACVGAGMTQDDEARKKALAAVFETMEKSIKDKDEAPFKARWHPEGFEKNLVGGSGLAGQEVYSQGSRKKWFMKPDLAQAKTLADGLAVIVPCDIWAWEKGRAVDKVDILVVKTNDAYIVLGGGEKRDQVEALASRWLKKEPLPPKE